MAASENRFRNVLEISDIDADWDCADSDKLNLSGDQGIPVVSIKFVPGAAGDYIVLLNGSASVELVTMKSFDGEARIEYFHGAIINPIIDFSASTLSAGHKVIIVIKNKY